MNSERCGIDMENYLREKSDHTLRTNPTIKLICNRSGTVEKAVRAERPYRNLQSPRIETDDARKSSTGFCCGKGERNAQKDRFAHRERSFHMVVITGKGDRAIEKNEN